MSFLNLEQLDKGLSLLDLNLSAHQKNQLDDFSSFLFRWNKTYNLTALVDQNDILTHHILDSVAVSNVFREYLKEDSKIIDVGSGGGLPAMPLAILFPDNHFYLVDTVGKKCAFLKQSALMLGLKNVDVYHSRVENLSNKKFDLITSRAFSSLKIFIDLSKNLISPNGYWLALKGQYPKKEIDELGLEYKVHVHEISVPFLQENRHLVAINANNR